MRTVRSFLLAFVLLTVAGSTGGCHAKNTRTEVDYTLAPRLPSPVAGTYTRYRTTSPDAVVAALTGPDALDASLSGAAAGLALRAIDANGGLTGWEVREALWQAGYPYPVQSTNGWTGQHGRPAPPALLAWLESQGTATDVGLVRAHGPSGVAWVGLSARPPIDIGLQPRHTQVGAHVILPPVPGGTYRASDPSGSLLSGPLEEGIQIRLIQPGEWLIEVRLDGQLAALFPVYAGIATPEEPLFEADIVGVINEMSATEQLSRKLAEVRDSYGLIPWSSNILLDKAASTGLKPGSSSEQSATAVGYSNSKRLSCEAGTIEDCLDSMIWDPGLRGLLLSDAPGELGVAAEISAQSLRFELLISLQTL